MTMGERLEEARKRRGISIREAAEATKVRGEYLLAMEENNMHKIPLPEIYKRGFLKNYARLLKLDPEKILTDYEAREISRNAARQDRDESEIREVLGRMMLPDDEDEDEPASATSEKDRDTGRRSEPGKERRRPGLELTDNTLFLKIAVGVGAVAILAVLIVVLVGLLRGGDTPPVDSTVPGTAGVTASPPVPTTPAASISQAGSQTQNDRSLTIRAQDSVTLIIDQMDPAERLYQGTLSAGDVISIEKQGPVDIRFSNGAALTIEQPNGQTIRPAQSSIGRIAIP